MNAYIDSYIKIIGNAVCGKNEEIRIENHRKLADISRMHAMGRIVYGYLREHGAGLPDADKYITMQDYRFLMQCAEYENVREKFHENGIRYMPLKGVRLRKLYPDAVMREMSDIDILTDKESMDAVRVLLCGQGYHFEHKGHHDVYTNEDGVCFEIHETLLDKQRDTGIEAYFKDPWSMAEKNGDELVLTPENEYIYLLAHLYGHFHQGGIGVRAVLDMYIFKNSYALNFDHIYAVLEKYGLKAFAKNIDRLTEVWFGDKEADSLIDELGEYIFTSGAYGRVERLNMDLFDEEGSKARHIWNMLQRKLFLSSEELQRRYPWAGNRLLRPMAYMKRAADALSRHTDEAHNWAAELLGTDRERVVEHKCKMRQFGVKEGEYR